MIWNLSTDSAARKSSVNRNKCSFLNKDLPTLSQVWNQRQRSISCNSSSCGGPRKHTVADRLRTSCEGEDDRPDQQSLQVVRPMKPNVSRKSWRLEGPGRKDLEDRGFKK